MSNQPEALWLVEVMPYLEGGERGQWIIDAAAELRRLAAVEAQRDALLELVVEMDRHEGAEGWSEDLRVKIDATIKAVEGENHAKNL